MSNILSAPDTIFEGFPGLNPNTGTPVVKNGGRLMSSGFHTDGMVLIPAGDCLSDSANLVLTRNGTGDWSYNRTAAGAETYHVHVNAGSYAHQRIGELYNLGLFGPASSSTPAAPPKGIRIIDVFAVMNVGVVSLTSATLRLSKLQYPLSGAAAAAPVVTDILAATALTTLTAQGAGAYLTQLLAVAAANQVIAIEDLSMSEIELTLVMANTGTVKIAGVGFHFNFNYT